MSVQLLLAQLYLYYNQLSPTKTRKTGKKKTISWQHLSPTKNRKTGKKKKKTLFPGNTSPTSLEYLKSATHHRQHEEDNTFHVSLGLAIQANREQYGRITWILT